MPLSLNKTAITIVVAVCVYAALAALSDNFANYSATQKSGDPVSLLESRFFPLLPLVANTQTVGYLAEMDYAAARLREFRLQDVEHIGRYYVAQYALAPVIVLPHTNPALVVSHFLDATPAPTREEGARSAGLLLITDVGNGIALYRKP